MRKRGSEGGTGRAEAPRIDQAKKSGIEFKALLNAVVVAGGGWAKALRVDRPSKNLSEYKASLIAAEAAKKRVATTRFNARFVNKLQPISVGV